MPISQVHHKFRQQSVWFLLLISLFCTGIELSARTYRFGMIPWIAYSPLHVAEVKGFWKNLGINVEVVPYYTNPELYNAIASGQVDISMDMIGSMVGMHQSGVPVKILGESDWSHGGDKIIIKQNLDSARLKAKPIGVYLNKPSVTFFLQKFLNDNKVKISEVKVIELTMQELADRFIDETLSVILNCDPDALRAERKGEGRLAATSADYSGCIPEGFVARSDILEKIPADDQVKIFRGWVKAVKWIHNPSNWDEYRSILNTVTFKNDGPFTDNDLREMLRSVRIHPYSTQFRRNSNPEGLKKYLQDLHDFLAENKQLVHDYQVTEILHNENLLEALKIESDRE
ncbi:MAG: ABC transporter substrate-binding protein [Candidatus Riflebacteria bacterium]|nr:ABC transporter substrate-binding protein [Candidatus Riflebacteria bacterium]